VTPLCHPQTWPGRVSCMVAAVTGLVNKMIFRNEVEIKFVLQKP
jgi:hypothetical protein